MKKMSNKKRQRQRQYQKKYKREFPYNWFWYCSEPLEDIEGWNEMLNDPSGQRWELHHRDEISEGGVVVRKCELKDRGVYYNLSASKLVFMTESEHMSLHNSGKRSPMLGRTGELHPKYKYGITKEDLYELYVVQGLTQLEIAGKFGCCQPRICIKLKEFGISRK